MDQLQEFIYLRTYSRFLWEEGRREYFEESVERYINWLFTDPNIPEKVKTKSREKFLNLEAVGSMRAFWTAGAAAEDDNAVIYNCSGMVINSLEALGEVLYLLMCGAGVGFSCESKHVSKLPPIIKQKKTAPRRHIIEDSRQGWKQAIDLAIETWWSGYDVYFDYSCLRPMGAPLRKMGGRSSGPDVLRQLLTFLRETAMAAQGRKLTSLEIHDLCCEIASVVIVGGTRRSALISISDLWDEDLRECKANGYHGRRNGANNSAAYYSKPDMLDFLDEWVALAKSGTGERGIANLWGARKNAPHRRKSKLIEVFNPCGEVALRHKGLCNLSEVIIRSDDDFESVRDKITTAVWLGVVQSTKTNFPYLSKEWAENAEEERLCGVSLTGQFDNPDLLSREVLRLWKAHALNVARKASKTLGINMPAAVTCVKPSGTVSKLVGSSAGIHPRWSEYYIQHIQIAKSDPLFKCLADQGIPFFDTVGAEHTAVLPFPVASPEGAITRHDLTALDQLEHYLKVTEEWCEHNASATIYVRKDEWLNVANWVYDHFDRCNGLTFFPAETETSYSWTPYQEITKEEYERRLKEFPKLDFNKLRDYEDTDQTTGAKEFACAGGACDL